jgi:cytochrome o ubiquinol oxidase subunit III
MAESVTFTKKPDTHQDVYSKNVLGFWIYLMTDCLIFGTLFATYAILHTSTFGGPSGKDLFKVTDVIAETTVLLVSSVTCGFATLSSLRNKKMWVMGFLILTFLLGASFVAMELKEFIQMAHEGNSWQKSAFLSSFFTLVGTHGLHVTSGLFWLLVLMGQIAFTGITVHTFRRLVIFSMFWHFLDLVWIFIFTFVYLMGVV